MTHPFAGNGSSLHNPSELLQLWSALPETYWALSAKQMSCSETLSLNKAYVLLMQHWVYNLNTHHLILISSVSKLNC